MKSLETELGVQLLERRVDGVALTDVGRRVYSVALGIVAIMDPGHPLAGREVLRQEGLDGQLFAYADSDYDNALLYWEDVRAQFRQWGLRFRSMAYPLDSEADWGADLGAGILLMPAGYRAVATERGRHKVVVPIEGITQTTLAAYREDDGLAALVASLTLEPAE